MTETEIKACCVGRDHAELQHGAGNLGTFSPESFGFLREIEGHQFQEEKGENVCRICKEGEYSILIEHSGKTWPITLLFSWP